MGLLRLFLALVVVVHHIPGHIKDNPSYPGLMGAIDAMVAVLLFFIFSGFYMSLVINQKYAKSLRHPWAFFMGRILRIFPLYWLILALTYVYDVKTGHLGNVGNIRSLSGFNWLSQVFMNVTTLGLDLVPSLGGGTLQLIGPAWTLGSEMLFYIFAPWLVRMNLRGTVALILVIFAVRLALYINGVDRYPYRVLFFPLSLGFFMLGHVSFLLYDFMLRKKQVWLAAISRRRLGLGAIGIVFLTGYVLHVGRGIDPEAPGLWVLYVLLTLLIPVIFHDLKRNPLDKFLGDLSFPLYISHSLVLTVVADYVIVEPLAQKTIAVTLSLAFAVLLALAIERPIERMRLWVNNKLLKESSLRAESFRSWSQRHLLFRRV